MSLILPSTKFINVSRVVTGTVDVEDSDQVLKCDTTLGPVTVNLKQIPANYWSTLYRLFIKDYGNNAATNNITIVAPTGFKVNGASTLVISTNGAAGVVQITSNTDYLCTIGASSGALTTFTVTNTPTIDLTLTPIPGGYNLQADSILQDSFVGVKILTQTNTSYCKRTNQYYLLQYTGLVGAFVIGETITGGTSGATGVILTDSFGTITYNTAVGVFVTGEVITGGTSGATATLTSAGKYENPFQSITNGSVFQNYTSKTETGAFAGAFDLVTGRVTIPSTGWYYIQSQIGWAINATSPYVFTSDNPNTSGAKWMASPSDIGSFSLTNYLIGSGLASVDLKTITQSSSQLYLYSNVLIKLTAGNVLEVVYTNNTDLELYGQPNSNIIFRGVKLSN